MAAPLYKPPTRVATIELPYLAMVVHADPDWARDKYWEKFYEFGHRRTFWANPYISGPYNPNFDNPAPGPSHASNPPPQNKLGILLTDAGTAILSDSGEELLVDRP